MTLFRCSLVAAVLSILSCNGGKSMMVDRKPIADFKFTQSSARPQVFVFDAAESRATVGSLAKFKWLFGDEATGGATTDVTSASTTHAYAAAGTFTVTLVVTDDKDTASDQVVKEVTVTIVNTDGPMAAITGPTTAQPNMMLTFDGSTSTPAADIQNYAWDFGDGMTTAGKDKTIVQHTFTAANRFRVTLTVTDSLGQNSTAELQVAVGDVGPVAVCSWSPAMPLQGVPVMFNGSMSTAPAGATIIVYVWDFGDGVNMVPGMMTQHTYTGVGPYIPKLKVVDSNGKNHETSCQQIVPGAPPTCDGDYSLTANPTMQNLCGLGNSTWAGVRLHITENPNGTVVATEQFGGMMLVYNGTWTGAVFHATGTFTVQNMGIDEKHDVVIDGTFTGCTGWTGTYKDTITIDLGIGSPFVCPITWNITSQKL